MTQLLPAAATDGSPLQVRPFLLGGRWTVNRSGRTFPVHNPGNGDLIATVADADETDALAGVEHAVQAQSAWAAVPPRDRGEILRAAFELMLHRAGELAELMTLKMGKPLQESHAEVRYAAEFFRWFSEEAVRVRGSWSTAPDGGSRLLTMRQPVGPCLMVTPWNFPLAMGTRKLGPALAAGCTAIVKPAKQTPLSMLALAEILIEAGLPDGVLSVLPTSGSAALVGTILADRRIRKLSFTGSTEVGAQLARQAADNLQRVSMELGGNAPFIVFDDADLDVAADQAMLAKLRNNGEACTAANRFYVHEHVLEQFAERLETRFRAVKVGIGTDPETTLGSLIDDAATRKVAALVDAALEQGAQLVHRGAIPSGTGSYSPPIILKSVPASAAVVQQEVFGPVVALVGFTSEEQVVDLANAADVGLASYVFTRDLDRAIRVAERLQVGMVGLNRGVISNTAAPFGGVKGSGYGREGGAEGIDEYLDVKYVSLATAS